MRDGASCEVMEDSCLTDDLSEAAAGKPDALQRLIVRHHGRLRGAVLAATDHAFRQRIDADDVLQQAYIVAFRTLADRVSRSPPADQASQADQTGKADRADQLDQADEADQAGRAEEADAGPAPRFGSPDHFFNWLKRVALDRLRDMQRALRRQKRNIAREARPPTGLSTSCPNLLQTLAGGDSTPSRHVAKDEAIAAVMSCLARLNDDQRDVVRMRFLEDVPVAQIAERLGKTETAVYTLCHRGLKSLRELMVSITHFLSRL